MQRVTLVRYTTNRTARTKNETLSRAVFRELSLTASGVIAALFRDGDDFVHLFVNLKGDDSAAVTELFCELQGVRQESGQRHVAEPGRRARRADGWTVMA